MSADVAHAVHPNYSDKYEGSHGPRMNHGLVIKYNSNQRYATNGQSAAYFKVLSKELVEELRQTESIFKGCQEFLVKNDSSCGSTIGPLLASQTGMMTIDVGIPILSMHSIREMMGIHDIDPTIALFCKFYEKDLKY